MSIMSVKSCRYLLSIMVIGGTSLFSGAQQASSTHAVSPAVFTPSTSETNQSQIAKYQQQLAELEHCKLASCKAEAADLKLQLSHLQAGQPQLQRTGTDTCSGATYYCNGAPGEYVYASITDSCATHVTAEACGATCGTASGTTSAYTSYESDNPNQAGTCSFTWTDNTGYHSIEIAEQ
jgi:hypothetical protein